MNLKHLLLITLNVLLRWQLVSSVSPISGNVNPHQHSVSLDANGRYNLTWLVDWTQRRVTFNVSVVTRGSIGFGLSQRDGKMDLVIGGVYPDGSSYFSDRYAFQNQRPLVDPSSEDWVLHMASESSDHTFLSFSRPFDTCDPDHDIPITDDLSTLIWAIGETDQDSQFHSGNRGSYPVYLLDPDYSPDLAEFKRLEDAGVPMNMSRFAMTATLPLPSSETMYWCHFFKAPTKSKRHIIGFSTEFPTEYDQRHVHHLSLLKCRAPPGIDAEQFFEEATKSEGSECYFVNTPHTLPTQYCQQIIHVWGVGGRPVFFPEHAGMTISEHGPEYFMVQGHYDNPNEETHNRPVTFTLNAFYTANIRENEVGSLPTGAVIPSATSIIIPPNSESHEIRGYCPAECLEKMLPGNGITAFAAFPHTHLMGTGVRFTHFRGDQELPWLSNADNYQFDFQQFRILIQERKILPGDQLGMIFKFDTRPQNGTTFVGGHSTRAEMAVGHVYYYTKGPIRNTLLRCRSELRTKEYMNLLGINATAWDPSRGQMVVTAPAQFAGISVHDYANQHIVWDLEMKEQLRKHQLYGPQVTQCPVGDATTPYDHFVDGYHLAWNPNLPGVSGYEKPKQCASLSTRQQKVPEQRKSSRFWRKQL